MFSWMKGAHKQDQTSWALAEMTKNYVAYFMSRKIKCGLVWEGREEEWGGGGGENKQNCQWVLYPWRMAQLFLNVLPFRRAFFLINCFFLQESLLSFSFSHLSIPYNKNKIK